MHMLPHYLFAAAIGFILGLLACDLSPAFDTYYEQQNRRYDMDYTNAMNQQRLQQQREDLYRQQQHRNPC